MSFTGDYARAQSFSALPFPRLRTKKNPKLLKDAKMLYK